MRLEAELVNWNDIIIGNDVEADWCRFKKKYFLLKLKISLSL